MRAAVLISMVAFALATSSGRAGQIGPGDVGSQATIETFDELSANTGGAHPLVLNGVTYDPGGYQIVAFNPKNYICVSGNCIENIATGGNLDHHAGHSG
jgi:hypothetical protein